MGILHTHPAALDPPYLPGGVAQQEYIALQAFDGEVLVHGADKGVVRLGDYVVVGIFRNGASTGHGRQRGTPPPLDYAVNTVAVQVSPAASKAVGEPVRQHLQDLVELLTGQVAIGVGPPCQGVKVILAPILLGARGDNLLGQYIGRPLRDREGIQIAATDSPGEADAFRQFVAGEGKQAALGLAADRVAGAANSLEQNADGPGRANLAYEVDVADVYAQLQRSSGYADFHLPGLQFLLGVEPDFTRQAAVVGDHRLLAEAFTQLVRDPLHEAAGVDEDKGRFVLLYQSSHRVQGFSPELVGRDWAQFLFWQAQGEVDFAGVARIHDGAVRTAVGGDAVIPNQEPRDLLDGLLGGRQADANHRLLGKSAQALHRQGKVGAAFVVGHSVDFIEDQGVDAPQSAPAAARGEQDVQRLGRGDEDVWGLFRHLLAF